MHAVAALQVVVVASHDDKAVSCARLPLTRRQVLEPPCARIAIISVQHSVLRQWSSRRCLSPPESKGAPREARCKDRCQRCRGHHRLCYLAQALGDITNAHPISRCVVFRAPHMLSLPPLPK